MFHACLHGIMCMCSCMDNSKHVHACVHDIMLMCSCMDNSKHVHACVHGIMFMCNCMDNSKHGHVCLHDIMFMCSCMTILNMLNTNSMMEHLLQLLKSFLINCFSNIKILEDPGL